MSGKADYCLGGLRSPKKVTAWGLAQSENMLHLLEGSRDFPAFGSVRIFQFQNNRTIGAVLQITCGCDAWLIAEPHHQKLLHTSRNHDQLNP